MYMLYKLLYRHESFGFSLNIYQYLSMARNGMTWYGTLWKIINGVDNG
ncbi:hypothetical protein LCGC14_1941960 [marine sediment metagenome]|uniref:Uncharacterized protein n=1 Tax=marine sediment metagenome TaxID=412755 RepID=A0A0F9FKA6_9ZZZZ